MSHLLQSIRISTVFCLVLFGCAHYHSSIVEEVPLKVKLEPFKHAVLDASSIDPKAEKNVIAFSSKVFQQLVYSKLFQTVSYSSTPNPNADLIIKAVIVEATLPDTADKSIFVADKRYAFKILYSLISKQDNKVLSTFRTNSDSGCRYNSTGTTEAGYAYMRSSNELIEYIKLHK